MTSHERASYSKAKGTCQGFPRRRVRCLRVISRGRACCWHTAPKPFAAQTINSALWAGVGRTGFGAKVSCLWNSCPRQYSRLMRTTSSGPGGQKPEVPPKLGTNSDRNLPPASEGKTGPAVDSSREPSQPRRYGVDTITYSGDGGASNSRGCPRCGARARGRHVACMLVLSPSRNAGTTH